jgi:hypothetical protein
MSAADVVRVWILGGTTPDFAFDAVLKEQHVRESAITEEPVDTGVTLSDHKIKRPARLAIEGAVSAIAFDPGDAFNSSTGREIKAWDLLTKLDDAAEPFIVQTGLQSYDNMMIATLSADQDAATGSALVFRAELQQVTIASTRTTTYPPRKPGKAARQGPKKVDGGQKDAGDVTQGKAKSALLSLGQSSSTATSLADKLLGIKLNGVTP